MLWVAWMELSAGSETKQGSLTESVGGGSHIIFGEYPMVGGSDSAVPSALPCQQQQLLPHQSLPHCWLFASWAAELSDCRNAGIDWDTAPPIDRTGETETPPPGSSFILPPGKTSPSSRVHGTSTLSWVISTSPLSQPHQSLSGSNSSPPQLSAEGSLAMLAGLRCPG